MRFALLAALVCVAASIAHAQTPVALRCAAGKTCKYTASVAASPEVDRVCMREISRPDKPVPASAFLGCAVPIAGKAEVILTNTGTTHVEFVAIAVDDDLGLESAGSDVHGVLLAPLPKPILEQAIEQVQAARLNAEDAVRHAAEAQRLLSIVVAGEESETE